MKGYVYVQCAGCGATKIFYAKEDTEESRCKECRTITKLDNLRRVHLACECGSRIKLKTNISDMRADVKCPKCGYHCAVEYSSRHRAYVPIEQLERGAHGK